MNAMIGYLRVSTREQAESGLGLAAQRSAIQAAATVRRWSITWAEDPGRSGATLNRPGLAHALADLAAGRASGLVVAKLDRVSRSVTDFAGLLTLARKQGWSFVALDLGVDTTTAAGELVANVMCAVAQWERRVTSDRTRDGLQEARANGRRLGRPRSIDPLLLTRIVAMRDNGMSHRAIAGELNTTGVPTVNGGRKWTHGTVGGLLTSARIDPVRRKEASHG